jgi:hypothetical protein
MLMTERKHIHFYALDLLKITLDTMYVMKDIASGLILNSITMK